MASVLPALWVDSRKKIKNLIQVDFNNLPFAFLKMNVVFVRRTFRNKTNARFRSHFSERPSYHFAKIVSCVYENKIKKTFKTPDQCLLIPKTKKS